MWSSVASARCPVLNMVIASCSSSSSLGIPPFRSIGGAKKNLDRYGGDGIRTHEPLRERISHARTYVFLDLESRQPLELLREEVSAAFDQALREPKG
jgi:hypothetical protein